MDGIADDAELPAGRHDVMIIGAEWRIEDDAAAILDVDCTFTTGERKGAVVTIGLAVGSGAFTALCALLGRRDVTAGDVGVTVAALAFPCTLVVERAAGGGIRLTFAP